MTLFKLMIKGQEKPFYGEKADMKHKIAMELIDGVSEHDMRIFEVGMRGRMMPRPSLLKMLIEQSTLFTEA